MVTKLASLFSGGKDSTYAIARAREMGHVVACLLTLHPAADDSPYLHYANSRITHELALAMAIPHLEYAVADGSREAEEYALEAVIAEAKQSYSVEGLLTGGISSVFQKDAFERVCSRLGLKHVSPAWGMPAAAYMQELLERGFQIMMVGVSAMGLGKEWLGKVLDLESLSRLEALSKKYGFNLNFEGGEAETLVLDCPLYLRRLEVRSGRVAWDGQRGIFEILDAALVEK